MASDAARLGRQQAQRLGFGVNQDLKAFEHLSMSCSALWGCLLALPHTLPTQSKTLTQLSIRSPQCGRAAAATPDCLWAIMTQIVVNPRFPQHTLFLETQVFTQLAAATATGVLLCCAVDDPLAEAAPTPDLAHPA